MTWLQHFSKLSPKTRNLYTNKNKGIHGKIPALFSIRRQVGLRKRTDLVSYLKKNDYLAFSFVRHPFDRLVSAYREKVEKSYHGLYVRSKLWKLYGAVDFDTFLKHVINTYKKPNDVVNNPNSLKSHRIPKKVDRHWRLFDARCSYCAMKYDVIGRAETFNEDAK